jgi:hypothetical protein
MSRASQPLLATNVEKQNNAGVIALGGVVSMRKRLALRFRRTREFQEAVNDRLQLRNFLGDNGELTIDVWVFTDSRIENNHIFMAVSGLRISWAKLVANLPTEANFSAIRSRS